MLKFDPEYSLETLIQLLGFVVGIGVIWYQLYKQRELQKESNLTQARREIYKEITTTMEHSSPAGISITLDLLVGLLKKARTKKEETGNYLPPPMQMEEIVDNFKRVQSNLFGVSGTIEKYEIVSKNQSLFRRAFIAKLRELSGSFLPIISLLPYLLPSENGISNPDKLLIPTDAELADIQKLVNDFKDIAGDIDGFLYDFQVEAQNILLGSLFDRKLEVRKPKDKKYLVLTSQSTTELKKVIEYVKKTEDFSD